MGKFFPLLVAISLSCLIWTLAVEAKRPLVQVRYQEPDSRTSPIDHVRIGQVRHTITDSKIHVPHGISDQTIIEWASNLRSLQEFFNVSKECGRQLGEFAANLNDAFSNLTSPLQLFDEKYWSLKGKLKFFTNKFEFTVILSTRRSKQSSTALVNFHLACWSVDSVC